MLSLKVFLVTVSSYQHTEINDRRTATKDLRPGDLLYDPITMAALCLQKGTQQHTFLRLFS